MSIEVRRMEINATMSMIDDSTDNEVCYPENDEMRREFTDMKETILRECRSLILSLLENERER